ncbi:VpaChn25_0724 family phage protein [Rhodobacter capsulatus]|uniref:VpaChn25_0724 family phage protein n=1 Tax=Rhodobacter capsulatus TaxID=1061 RepID=UPI0040299F90
MSQFLVGYIDHYNEAARLTILRSLAQQPDGRLNESLLHSMLEDFAFRRGRSWLRTQLRWLEQEAGAVVLREVPGEQGPLIIAQITEAGNDHVERRQVLDGVKRPAPVRG